MEGRVSSTRWYCTTPAGLCNPVLFGDDGGVKETRSETTVRVGDASSGREQCAFVREIGGDLVIAVADGLDESG